MEGGRKSRVDRPLDLPLITEPSDLNKTLLKREHFSNLLRKGTYLHQKSKRASTSKSISQQSSPILEEIKAFMKCLCIEFQTANYIIDVFLKGFENLEDMMKGVVAMLPSTPENEMELRLIQKSFFAVNNDPRLSANGMRNGDQLSPILHCTRSALQHTQQATNQLLSATEEIVRFLEPNPAQTPKYSDADVMKTIQTCRTFQTDYQRDVSSLQSLCADANGAVEQVKHCISRNKWKEIEHVRNAIGDARRKVRDLQNLSEKSIGMSAESEKNLEDLSRDIEELERSDVKTRTEKLEKLEKKLRNLKVSRASLNGHLSETKKQYDVVETATCNVRTIDPSSDWKTLQVPLKHKPLCCLIRGPIEIISHLKIIHRKKNHLRNAGLLDISEEMISDVIELNNLSTNLGVKWPLILCIPQKKIISTEEEKQKVYVKYSRDTHSRHWNKEPYLNINQDYSKKLTFTKDMYFTEVKITCFATYATVKQCTSNNSSGSDFLDPSSSMPNPVLNLLAVRQKQRDAVLSDPFLYQLGASFHEMWKRIVINLGVPIDAIKSYEMNYPHSKEDVILSCLNYWKKTSSDSTQKVEDLKKVLKSCDREDLVEMVTEREQEVNKSMTT